MAIVIREIKVVTTVESKGTINNELTPELLKQLRDICQKEMNRKQSDEQKRER